MQSWSIDEVVADGERVVHLAPDNCFQAHLSIYEFASAYCAGAAVLDVGSGTGYGAALLAERGARLVHGIDLGTAAVAFSQAHFRRPNLHFQVLGAGAIEAFGPEVFDLIFTSNTLEHVADIAGFLRGAVHLLRPGGVMIVAVPPITSDELWVANIANPYHLNIWSPRQWSATLARYFAEVEHYAHYLPGPERVVDFNRAADRAIGSGEWLFERTTLAALEHEPTLTAVFVLRRPRAQAELPPPAAPPEFVDASFTRHADQPTTARLTAIIAQLEQGRRATAAQLAAQQQRQAPLEQALREQAAYAQRLEQEVARKNAHIAHCEATIERIESGRVMRIMRRLRRG